MFGKKTEEAAVPIPSVSEVGLLGVDSRFEGTIRFKGTLRIDGTVTGTIRSKENGTVLIINQNAVVKGDIVADAVLISGRVEGNVKAEERVEVFRTGILRGDLYTGTVMIEGGAEFQGECHMIRDLDAEQRRRLMEPRFGVEPAAGGAPAARMANGGTANGGTANSSTAQRSAPGA
ncbi:MAG: polymer-forming cytoskeletal protein [Candidatus Lambdaproteobacteria bacterium]|nr:polymer-forming cytoskeletal protein [Candidatus Lambdaproteobacteria bacterium]